MPDFPSTHRFVHGALASTLNYADIYGSAHPGYRGLDVRALGNALRLYAQPGIRCGSRVSRERPRSAAGAQTCHFSLSTVSKSSVLPGLIRAAKAGRRYRVSGASAHARYIERPGAAERIGPQPDGWARAALVGSATGSRASHQASYIERPGAAEIDPGDGLEDIAFGTIGETREERQGFWNSVEEAERSPRGDTITLDPGADRAWWERAVPAIDEAPAVARPALRAAVALDGSEPIVLKMATDDAFALWRWAWSIDADAPIEVEPGRGGCVQNRIIAELPHELDGHGRRAIVRAFTEKLEAKGFPYWAVVHAPGADGDDRNRHVHIDYYDRPARRVPHPVTGEPVWDFTITREKKRSNGSVKLERPYRQSKDRDARDRAWIRELRGHWGACCNTVLAEAGLGKRVDLRSYKALGIDRTPGVHIPARHYNKERKGGLTKQGVDLALQQWQTEADLILAERAAATGTRISLVLAEGRQAEIAQVKLPPPTNANQSEDPARRMRALVRRGLELVEEIGRLELTRDLARWVVTRTVSRPRLLLAAGKTPGHRETGKATDPPVPEGSRVGFKRRSDLDGFCDRLEIGDERLTAAYDARIAGLRRQLGRTRTELLPQGRAAVPAQDAVTASLSRALAGDIDAGAIVEPVNGHELPPEPMPATVFRARVRASLDPTAVALWDRFAAEPERIDERTVAVVATASRPAIMREPASLGVPGPLDTATQPPAGPEASYNLSWAGAVSRAATQRGRAFDEAARGRARPGASRVEGVAAISGGPVPPQPRPHHDLALGLVQGRRSNGAPLIPSPTPGIASPPSKGPPVVANPASFLPTTSPTEAPAGHPAPTGRVPGPVADRPAAPASATPVAAESVAVEAVDSSLGTPGQPIVSAPMLASVVKKPDEQAAAQAAEGVADVTLAQAIARSEHREAVPLPSAAATARPVADGATDPVRAVSSTPRPLEPELRPAGPDPSAERGGEPQSEMPIRDRKAVVADPLIAPDRPADAYAMGDPPESDPPRLQAPEPALDDPEAAVRLAPHPAPLPEAPPRSVPAWAVKGAKGTVSGKGGGVRPSPTPSRNGRGGRGGRGIGD